MRVYFSDFFNVSPEIIEQYGAFNVSLINDLPMFIDPFLLFNSEKLEYQGLHAEILKYVAFLRDKSVAGVVDKGLLRSWYCFGEIKQTWLGFSKVGNEGRGPGMDFAIALDQNLKTVFSDFDQQSISKSPHLEKLCLIKDNIGKDNISDFTTNLIKGFLLGYTQTFALSHIAPELRREIRVERAQFNYTTQTWVTKTYTLPFILNNYVLLAPRDILTKDENWINKKDLTRDFQAIVDSVSDAEVRSLLNNYFLQNLPPPQKTKKDRDKQPSQEDIAKAVFNTIEKYPYILDYFLKHKEETGDQAQDISKARVAEVYSLFVEEVSVIIAKLSEETEFYETPKDTLESAYQRVLFLKNVVENKDGYRVFYKDGNPIKREADVHVMYRLTWYAAPEAVSREANEGRGPVDFVVSNGAKDKSLVEFKLASNSKLKQNLESQVEIYQRAHDTDKKIKVILFFSEEEAIKTHNILKEIKLENEKYIVMIDARNDNKPSASNAKKISEE